MIIRIISNQKLHLDFWSEKQKMVVSVTEMGVIGGGSSLLKIEMKSFSLAMSLGDLLDILTETLNRQ